MGLLKKLTDRVLGKDSKSDKTQKQELLRRCYFEVMEQRRVLSADPVIAGVTYLEGDAGQDTAPDHFEVTFEGGAETTQLTQFVINGDQDGTGTLTDGDKFFDVNDQTPGAGGFHGFQFDAANSVGITASDITGFTVSDNGMVLTVNLQNFEAGDKLAFTIDVDEVENLRNDKIASGVEFEGSLFSATFEDDNYVFVDKSISVDAVLEDGQPQTQNEGIFFDEYNTLFNEGQQIVPGDIDLALDNETGQADRTAAALDAYELEPKPITISGSVYHDENTDCHRDSDEDGIANVEVTLQQLNEATGTYEDVAVTTTDANGRYEFGLDLDLRPGTYRLVETQPDGFLSVGADPGSVDGTGVGSAGLIDNEPNIIGEINVPLGGTAATNYDFCEVKPASIEGKVWHDEDNDGVFDANEQGIANVLIQVNRVGAKDGVANDPFADQPPIFVRTDANGCYKVDSLPPGIYEVIEINNYPPGEVDPLASFVDGKDSVGNVGGTTVGNGQNDKVTQIKLCAGDEGVEYNFGELKPASISGYVSVQDANLPKLDPSDPNFEPISGVTINLLDADGNFVTATQTDATGAYSFDNLAPGTYSIVQVQPDSYLDGGDILGSVDGVSTGSVSQDRFDGIVVGSGDQGTRYDFCEHIPASVKGTVYHDRNDNGVQDAGEEGIGGVVIQLFDADGNLVQETRTDANGDYCFEDLLAGEYKIREVQPVAFADGLDAANGEIISADGSRTQSGVVHENDEFCEVILVGGDQGVEFNFGEIRLASISGSVHADADGDKSTFDVSKGDQALANVTLVLLDAQNNEVARTVTDANGDYSFEGLRPGEYSVREIGPDGYIDGIESAGTVDGTSVGQVSDDLLSGIVLGSGSEAVNYDFCEHIPAELHGNVWHDENNDGVFDSDELGIAGVTIQLFDEDGNLVRETETMDDGGYWFTDLLPGVYKIQEIQPTSYIDGKENIGQVDGVNVGNQANDMYTEVRVNGGDVGVKYDFGEILLAQISGMVHVDANGDCNFSTSDGDRPLAGVVIELLDADGNVLQTTTTDANGQYEFDGLLPGTYSVRQIQPEGFVTSGDKVGTGGGDASENLLTNIVIESGQNVTNYDFCETELSAEIHGRVWEDGPAIERVNGLIPENYRDLRDGVYQEGVDTPIAGVRMELYYYIDPANSEIAPRPVTLGEVNAEDYAHMGTTDPNAAVWVETMENGEYWFTGLQPGNYIVLETQPEGFFDSNDTRGSTTGFTVNSLEAANQVQESLRIFSGEQIMDSVVNIRVNAGGISEFNNFSEVRFVDSEPPTLPPPLNPPPLQPPGNPTPPSPGQAGYPGLFGSEPSAFTQFIGTSRGASFQTQANPAEEAAPYTWHLSVVNGGIPRGEDDGMGEDSVWQQAGFISNTDWNRFDMDDAVWTFTETRGDNDISVTSRNLRFGMLGGTPLAGDFDGDGTDEVAVYKDGYWMIDLNRNGRWDETDLLARLGDADDRPVVGDWDGDGKDDIGIYGPMWEDDPAAIERDPGLPNPDNSPFTKPKNVPPVEEDSSRGARVMKLTSYGRQRADVVDHVFGIDDENIIPVTGDWNGNGIRSIGTFEDGVWHLDVNGDGRFDHEDVTARFGRAGDTPVVGDFNGDGIEEIAVYRAGTWLIDTDGNRELNATDKTFDLGGASDKPVVGDWDGDGTDEPGLYSEQQSDPWS